MMQPFQKNIHNNVLALNQLKIDYKSAIVAAEMIDNGLGINKIKFKHLSIFKRFVAKEIERITINDEEEAEGEIQIEINREGLYDMLPEALTHPSGKKFVDETTSEEFQRHRQEENDARLFFAHLETEFQSRILYFEMIERELFCNTIVKKDRQFFEYFYGNSSSLDNRQMQTLLYILPLSYKIRGDIKLISFTLSKILKYVVDVTKKLEHKKIEWDEELEIENRLGVNFVLSNFSSIYIWQYKINIRNIDAKDFKHFLKGGVHKNVIDFVIEYFFAVNAEIEIIPHVQNASEGIILSDEHTHYLDFNTYL